MKTPVIKDLFITEELDRKAMSTVRGGRTISMFLRRVWRDGALFGGTPSETRMESETTEAASGDVRP